MSRKVEDSDVALAIELATMCETFNCLPAAGGLLDQDPLLLHMMREVLQARHEKAEIEGRKNRGA
jgi:hypothetical protein